MKEITVFCILYRLFIKQIIDGRIGKGVVWRLVSLKRSGQIGGDCVSSEVKFEKGTWTIKSSLQTAENVGRRAKCR